MSHRSVEAPPHCVEPTQQTAAADSWATRSAYAAGTAGFASLVASVSFYYPFFLTDVVLLPPALAATAILAGKLWDTVNDPLTGMAMDRLRHRFPLKRWLVWSAAPLGLATAGVWWVPAGLSPTSRLLWAVGAYLVFDTVFSVAQLAFSALGAEAERDYDARTRLMSFGALGAVLGFMVGSVAFRLSARFADTPAQAYALAGAAMGGLVAVGSFVAGRWLEEQPARPLQPLPSRQRVLWSLRQPPFVLLVGAVFCARAGLTVVSASLPYFAKYRLNDEALASSLMVTLLVVVGALIPFWKRVADRWSKAKTYGLSLGLAAVGFASTWLLGPSSSPLALFASIAVAGVGMAGHWVLPWALLPDVVDWDEARTGERRTGLYFALYGLVDKLARTVALASIGWVLSTTGFVANVAQADTSLLAIRALAGPVPALLILGALPLLFFYPLDRATHQRLRELLDRRALGATRP